VRVLSCSQEVSKWNSNCSGLIFKMDNLESFSMDFVGAFASQ